MTGGSCHSRKRSWRAPLGFCPLQRSELRKSTNPGFPSPGLFPSRRFSRPQGLTPSEAARAYSIPQPLMGFHRRSLPVGRDALAGKPVVLRVPPSDATARRMQPLTAPHGGWIPRRIPALRAVRTSALTARLQPRCPLAGGQTHLRDKALLAARTSSEPAFLQPRPASRTFLPGLPGAHPKASSDRAGREPTEGPHVPKDVGLRRLRASTEHALPSGGVRLGASCQAEQAPTGIPFFAVRPSTDPKACLRPRPHSASTRPDSYADLALRSATHRGKEQAPSVAGGDPSGADEHKARRHRRPDPVEGVRPRAVPGERRFTVRAGSKPPTRQASCLPNRPSRSPVGPETRRRMDEVASVCKPRDRPRLRGVGSKLPLPRSRGPPRRNQARGPALPAKRTLRDGADALGAERTATCVRPGRRTSKTFGTGRRAWSPRGRPPPEALCRDRACQPRAGDGRG